MDYTREYASRRERMQFKLRIRREEIYSKYPHIAEIEREFASLQYKRLEDREFDIKTAISQNRNKLRKALTSEGYESNYLDLQYYCSICQDYGTLHNSQPCECKSKLIQEENKGFSNLNPEFTFENFDPEVFYENEQRADMLRLKTVMENFCNMVLNGEKTSVLLNGRTGLGKTYLMHCCGNKLLNKGYTVRYLTAMQYIQFILDEVVAGKKVDNLHKLLEIDFLLIDDLGAEAMIPNITEQHMLNLVDSRAATNKSTMYATNQNPRQLVDRYGDRIASRLLEKKTMQVYMLQGKDIRLK